MSILFVLLLASSCYGRISVMYAHDKLSDMVAEQCLNEMYPKAKRVEVQESDEPCIIFCVLKKFGIMTANGAINVDVYRKRIQTAVFLEQRNVMSDYGSNCAETIGIETAKYKQDVCRKAKAFNDCTRLYRILNRK